LLNDMTIEEIKKEIKRLSKDLQTLEEKKESEYVNAYYMSYTNCL